MVDAGLLAVGLVALVASAIVVRRLTVIAARLVEVIEGLRTVRAEIRGRLFHPLLCLSSDPVTTSDSRKPIVNSEIRI
jgi:hypothetical protein